MRKSRADASSQPLHRRRLPLVQHCALWIFLFATQAKADHMHLAPVHLPKARHDSIQEGANAAAPKPPAMLQPRQIAPSATGALILGQPSYDPSTGGFLGYPIPASSSADLSDAASSLSTPSSILPSIQAPAAQNPASPSIMPATLTSTQNPSAPMSNPSVTNPISNSNSATMSGSSAIQPPVDSTPPAAATAGAESFSATPALISTTLHSPTSAGVGSTASDRGALTQTEQKSSSTLTGSQIAGIVVGSVIGGLLIIGGLILLLLFCRRKRRQSRGSTAVASVPSEKQSRDFESHPAVGHDTSDLAAGGQSGLSQNPISPRFAMIEQTPFSPTVKSEAARMADRQSRYSEFSPVEPYSASSETPMLQQQQAPRSALSGTTVYTQPPPLAVNPRPNRHRGPPSDVPASVLGAGAASQEKRVGTPVSPITPTFLNVPPPGTFLDSPTNSWPSLGTISDQQHASMASDRSSGPWMGVSGPMSIDAATAATARDLRRTGARQEAADTSSSIEPPAQPRDSVVPAGKPGANEHARKSSDELPLTPPPKSHSRTVSNDEDQPVYPSYAAGFNFGLTGGNQKASRVSTQTMIHDPVPAAQPSNKPSQSSLSNLPPPPRSPLRTLNTVDLPPEPPQQAQTSAARSGWTTPSGDGAASGYWTPAEERTPRATPQASRENLHSRSRSRSRSRTVSRSRAISNATTPYLPPDFRLAQTSPTFDDHSRTPRSPTVPAEQTLSGYADADWRFGESTRFADGPSQQLAMPHRGTLHDRGGSLGSARVNARRGDRSTSTRGTSSSGRSNYSRPRGSESRSRSRSLGRELELDTDARYDYADRPPGGMI